MSVAKAPPIPHVTDNQFAFSRILHKQSEYTFKELSQFLKSLEASTQSDNEKKRTFLELLVRLRQNFVRLYVLCKWARNSHSVQKLVDLFVWLREQNQVISNALAQLGAQKQSLMSAKIPNPDLATALEVLVKGRPQLPTHNFIPDKKIEPALVLKTLRKLDVILGTKMALVDDLPRQFYQYTVANGRVTFTVPNAFQCAVSVADEDTKPEPNGQTPGPVNPFYLVDFKLGFKSEDGKLVPAVNSLPSETFHHLERFANRSLVKTGLKGLYTLLHEYAITCKLYTLHRQLLVLRMGLWRGHLTHTYQADRCFIVVTYWLQRKAAKSSIEIGKMSGTDELGFRWIKEGLLDTEHAQRLSLCKEDGSIDIESLIRQVINLHIELSVQQIQAQLSETVDNADKFCQIYGSTQLVLNVSRTRSAVYSIDPLSGDGYFQNPHPVMRSVARQINADPSNACAGLLRLRLETQVQELSAQLNATGWQHVSAVRLPSDAMKPDTEFLKKKQLASQLFSLLFFRRPGWPSEWFLVAGVPGFSTQPQFWVARLRSSNGTWRVRLKAALQVPQQQDSYSALLQLVETSSSAIVCHLIVKELQDRNCKIKTLDRDDAAVQKFVKSNFDITVSSNDVALLLLSNSSLYSIPYARDSLVLVASIVNGTASASPVLSVRIFGKLQKFINVGGDEKTIKFAGGEGGSSVSLNRVSGIFTVSSQSDLAEKLSGNGLRSSENSPESPAMLAGLSLPSISTSAKSILGGLMSVLKRLSGLLMLLQIFGKDPGLKLQNVSLDKVSFEYGTNSNECVTLEVVPGDDGIADGGRVPLTESLRIEMPPDNPQAISQRYLNTIVSEEGRTDGTGGYRAVGELVIYLRLTLPLYKSYLQLQAQNATAAAKFSKDQDDPNIGIKDLKLSPEHGCTPTMAHFETLKLLYYQTLSKGKKNERFRCNLVVSLRHRTHRVSLTSSVYLIHLENPYDIVEDSSSSLVREHAEKVKSHMEQYFKGEKPIPVENAGVVSLKNGVACGYEHISEVVNFLHGEMESAVYKS